MHRLTLLALAMCACGRIGFDALSDGGTAPNARSLVLPDGGQMSKVALAPDGTWYALANTQGAFRSTDQGATWTHCGARIGTGIAVSGDNDVWLSGTDIGRSTDGCATWMDTGDPRYSENVYADGSSIWALDDDGLRIRNGSAWTPVPTPADTHRFDVMGRGPLRYFIGTDTQGLLVSPDAVTWTAVTTGLDSLRVSAVGGGPAHSYAMTEALPGHGISCSDATGATWTSCYASGGLAMLVDPANDQHVIAAVYDDLAETSNAFASAVRGLREMSMDSAIVEDMQWLPDGGILLASDRGVFASAGASPLMFSPRHTGLDAWDIDNIVQDGEDMWLVTRGGPLHSIRGAPFTLNTTGVTGNTVVRGLAVAPDGSVWLGGRSVFRSTDRGETWTELHSLGSADGYYASEIVFIGTRAFVGTGARILSTDPPYTTWTPHFFSMVAAVDHSVIAMHVRGSEVWIGTSQGLQVTTDMGVTITPVAALGTAAILDFVDLADGRLVVSSTDGVWISDPATFGAFSRAGLAGVYVDGVTLVGDTLFAATDQGVRYTRDLGATWTPLSGAENLASSATLLDDTTGQLLVGTDSRGLVRVPLP